MIYVLDPSIKRMGNKNIISASLYIISLKRTSTKIILKNGKKKVAFQRHGKITTKNEHKK